MPVSERKDEQPIRSGEDFMRRFFPKEYARRKAEGRCIDCGAKKDTRHA